MKLFQYKYRPTANPKGEAILGSRNNPKGRHKIRFKVWNGPRSKLLSGTGKRLARLMFDTQLKYARS